MSNDHDPLWDPSLPPDPELKRMQALLSAYRVRPAKHSFIFKPRARKTSPAGRWIAALAAGIVLALSIPAWFQYRLAWQNGRAWQATTVESAEPAKLRVITPGGSLTTNATEMATIAVARIGSIRLSPDSTLRLVETRTGTHRVSLALGHMRARIWAPPGYFSVDNGAAEVVDLGCDFDVWKHADGSGRVSVRSGWVAYRITEQEILVPAGFEVQFDAQRVSTPTRSDADPTFRVAVGILERALADEGTTSAGTMQASNDVAARLQDADAFTALSLLTRYPKLARTALYSRLALALNVPGDDATHHFAWIAGDQEAIDTWWQRMPTQPKQWWANWSDAFN